MKELILIGGGGHARVLIEVVRVSGEFHLRGILDPVLPAGQEVSGVPVLGGDELLSTAEFSESLVTIAFGLMRAGDRRQKLYESLIAKKHEFPVLRHPFSQVASRVTISQGSQIMAGVVIQPGGLIGVNAVINTGALIDHDCRIGDHVFISPGAVLGGGVTLGDGSFIGLGARLLPGVRVGPRATVGAGAVVTEEVPEGSTVVGVPARRVS